MTKAHPIRLILTAVVASLSTALLVAGLSGGAQPVGPGEFVVVDSTGNQMGILLTHTRGDAPLLGPSGVAVPH